MSDAENRAFELLAIAEQQQKEIEAAISAIQFNNNKLNQSMAETARNIAEQTARQTAEGMQKGLTNSMTAVNNQAVKTHDTLQKISLMHYVYFFGGLFAILILVFAFAVWWIPTLDTIKQRKADLERYSLDVKTCPGNHPCVRVKTGQCMNDKDGNLYCVADTDD